MTKDLSRFVLRFLGDRFEDGRPPHGWWIAAKLSEADATRIVSELNFAGFLNGNSLTDEGRIALCLDNEAIELSELDAPPMCG